MGALNNAFDGLVAALTAANIPVATTANSARPGTVVVEPCSANIQSFRGANRLCEFPVVCICPPPGDYRAMRALNDLTDAVLAVIPATSITPGSYSINGNDLPCVTVNAVWPSQA